MRKAIQDRIVFPVATAHTHVRRVKFPEGGFEKPPIMSTAIYGPESSALRLEIRDLTGEGFTAVLAHPDGATFSSTQRGILYYALAQEDDGLHAPARARLFADPEAARIEEWVREHIAADIRALAASLPSGSAPFNPQPDVQVVLRRALLLASGRATN